MAPTDNGKTILLAEDEKAVRGFVLPMLLRNGYHVIEAVNGLDALEKARQFKRNYPSIALGRSDADDDGH
jgi:CheY-like chemotaxis protein